MSFLSYGFRPFFLLGSLYAAVLMLGWTGLLFLDWPVASGTPPLRWHAHEMLFGVLPAAVAGFLLTAICAWTGTRPVRGVALALLVLLWAAGRAAMWSAQWLPAPLIVTLDLAFLLVLAAYLGTVIVRAGSHRNLIVVAALLALAGASAASHAGLWWQQTAVAAKAEGLAALLALLLIVIIGGRITPAFSANWLRQQGKDAAQIRVYPALDWAALLSAVLLVPAALLAGGSWLTSVLALGAAVANGARLLGWSGWYCWRNPLLWILHLGYAWVVITLLLYGLAPWLATVHDAVWLHAAGVGAMGTMVLGVMTRVALGHSGRPLLLPTGGVLIYIAITAAALLRVGSALGWLDYRFGLAASAFAWIAAFLLFVVLYWTILTGPRIDAGLAAR